MDIDEKIENIANATDMKITKEIKRRNNAEIETLLVRDKDNPAIAFNISLDAFMDMPEDECIELIQETISDAKNTISKTKDLLCDANYVKSHLYLGIEQSNSTPDILYRDTPLFGINQYMYCRTHDSAKIMITKDLAKQLEKDFNLLEDDLWKFAADNTFNEEPNITDIVDVMAELMGMPVDVLKMTMPSIPSPVNPNMSNLLVLSNTTKRLGAVQILNPKVIKWLDANNISKAVIIPSSIHEVLLYIPETKNNGDLNIDTSALIDMVETVNQTEVAPSERLSDYVYAIDNSGNIQMQTT